MDHEQRAFAPLASTTRDFRIPGPTTGVSTPASTKAEMSALPLETPSTSALKARGLSRWTREESAGKRGALAAYRVPHGPQETRSTHLISSPRADAG